MSESRHTHFHSFVMLRPCSRCSLALLIAELVKGLLLEGGWLGEAEGDLVGGKLLVGVSHNFELLLNSGSVEWVKEDALGGLSGGSNSGGAADDGGWHNNVVEELSVDSLEGSRSWSLLGGVSVSSLGLDGSLGSNNDLLGEFLLEVLNNLSADLLEVGEGSEWDLDNDVLLDGTGGVLELNLLGRRDEDVTEVSGKLSLAARLLGAEDLGGHLLELGWLSVALDLKLRLVEHR